MTVTVRSLAATSPPAEKAAFGVPTWTMYDTATNTALSAIKAALAQQQHYLTHVTLSFSAAPATALVLTIKDGTTIIWQTEISTDVRTFTENFETRPLHASTNAALNIEVGAAGSGVVQTISASGFSVMAP